MAEVVEMDGYKTRRELMGLPPLDPEAVEAEMVVLPDTDDLVELAKAAVPALVRKAVMLAHESKSLPAVLAVLNSMMDRSHGKPVQSMQHMGPGGGAIQAHITLEFVEPGGPAVDVVSERVMLGAVSVADSDDDEVLV